MGLFITLVSQVSGDKVNEKNYERTIQSMLEIKKAILGTHSERVRGDIRFAGYVEDMGDLPELIDGQPKGLWTRDIDGDGNDDLPSMQDYFTCHSCGIPKPGLPGRLYVISMGWRGPYIKPPQDGVLKDGWGNPFIFKRIGNNFIIMSLGADGKQGGTGYAGDIMFTIKENDYLAIVAGYVSPYVVYHNKVVEVEPDKTDIQADERKFKDSPNSVSPFHNVEAYIYYAPMPDYKPTKYEKGINMWDLLEGAAYFEKVEVDRDGYFSFHGDRRIPIGTERILVIIQPVRENNTGQDVNITQAYRITIEPGLNWLGNMGSIP